MDRVSRREQIAEEALKLASQGVSAITMENVARSCGVVSSALYRHYRNKDELFDGVLALVRSKLLHGLDISAEKGKTPLDMLRMLSRRHAELLYQHPGILRLIFSDAVLESNSARRNGIIALMKEYRTVAASIALKGQETGQIRKDIRPEDVVFMLLGSIIPPSFLYHVSGGDFDPREQVKRSYALFEESIRAAR